MFDEWNLYGIDMYLLIEYIVLLVDYLIGVEGISLVIMCCSV